MGTLPPLYRPASLVRLKIRLEDFSHDNDDPEAQSGSKPFSPQLKKLREARADLDQKIAEMRADLTGASTVAGADAAQRRKVIQRKIAALTARAPLAKADAEGIGDLFSIDILTIPIDASVEVNTYKTADTVSVKLPFRDAPLESQMIRSCLLEVYGGTISAEDFATPGRWRLALDKTTILFRGYIDEWETSHDESDALVTIKARSLEAILIDEKINPLSKLFRLPQSSMRITDYVDHIMANVPATSGRTGGDQLKSFYFGATEQPSLSRKDLLRVLQSAQSRNAAAGTSGAAGQAVPDQSTGGTETGGVEGGGQPGVRPPGQELSAWDLIVQACAQVGMIPQYDPSFLVLGPDDKPLQTGDFILIRPPQTLFQDTKQGQHIQGGALDGFKRDLPDVNAVKFRLNSSDIRLFVWGRNIKSFTTSRKLGRIKVTAVEVAAFNPDAPPAKRNLRVMYPSKAAINQRYSKGNAPEIKIIRRNFFGIRSEEQLKQIAVALYHAVSRQELSVRIQTDDMASYIDPNTQLDPNATQNLDILRLRHGTPVRVSVARKVVDPLGSNVTITPLSEIFERRGDELEKFLTEQRRRVDPTEDPMLVQAQVDTMVRRLTNTINNPRRNDIFYTKTISHTWSAIDGWGATIELINYIEARNLPKNLSETDLKDDQKRKRKDKPARTLNFSGQGGLTTTSRVLNFSEQEGFALEVAAKVMR